LNFKMSLDFLPQDGHILRPRQVALTQIYEDIDQRLNVVLWSELLTPKLVVRSEIGRPLEGILNFLTCIVLVQSESKIN